MRPEEQTRYTRHTIGGVELEGYKQNYELGYRENDTLPSREHLQYYLDTKSGGNLVIEVLERLEDGSDKILDTVTYIPAEVFDYCGEVASPSPENSSFFWNVYRGVEDPRVEAHA